MIDLMRYTLFLSSSPVHGGMIGLYNPLIGCVDYRFLSAKQYSDAYQCLIHDEPMNIRFDHFVCGVADVDFWLASLDSYRAYSFAYERVFSLSNSVSGFRLFPACSPL